MFFSMFFGLFRDFLRETVIFCKFSAFVFLCRCPKINTFAVKEAEKQGLSRP